MESFVTYLLTNVSFIFDFLQGLPFADDKPAFYMAFGFILLSILLCMGFCFALLPALFRWVYSMFGRSAK